VSWCYVSLASSLAAGIRAVIFSFSRCDVTRLQSLGSLDLSPALE